MAKLAHQPFEDWLLGGERLSAAQTAELHAHLLDCDLCQRLYDAVHGIEHMLRADPLAEPRPGFVERWQIYLVADQLRQQRGQTLLILLFSFGGAGLLLALLALFVFPLLQAPAPVLMTTAYNLVRVFIFGSTVGETIGALARTLLGLVPDTMWISIAVALMGLSVVWLVALQKLSSPRRILS
jgi:predicted anti-sigma-YlaC factor YlaD